MDACKGKIRTIVMIDDNWMALGTENPRYKSLFGPGQPPLETFLQCVRSADVTIVYNRFLAEDIGPFARRVVELSPYVDPDAYPRARGNTRRQGLLAGYSGSSRPDTGAFRALAHFAERHADVEVLFLGGPLPEELSRIESQRIHQAPFQMSYEGYTQRIADLQPDILLAPLDNSRASASKAPNKFLEISILGAAGIYSRVPPYTDYVQEGQTGLLAGNDESEWIDALERLYSDRTLLRCVASAAAIR